MALIVCVVTIRQWDSCLIYIKIYLDMFFITAILVVVVGCYMSRLLGLGKETKNKILLR